MRSALLGTSHRCTFPLRMSSEVPNTRFLSERETVSRTRVKMIHSYFQDWQRRCGLRSTDCGQVIRRTLSELSLVTDNREPERVERELERIPSHHHFPSNLDAALPSSASVSLSSSSSFPPSRSLPRSLRRPHKNCATSLVSRNNDVVTSCTNVPRRRRRRRCRVCLSRQRF